MNLFGIRQALLAAGVVVAVCCVSCNQQNSQSSAAAKNVKPGPEESFNVIYDTFRRQMEEAPVGFVVSDSNTRSMMSGAIKVSGDLIRPTNDTDPFKAVITVVSQSRYSITRTVEDVDEKPRDKDADAKQDDPLAVGDDASFFDSGAKSKGTIENPAPRKTPRPGEEAVTRRPDEAERKFELLYQNGRWTLITKPNPDTEQAVQNAFKNALETQI
jgi:hypothetical protein